MMQTQTLSDVEFVATRTFDAPRELVFDAWTNAGHFAKWIGPRGIRTRVDEFDVRPGGRYRFVQWHDGGEEHAFHGVYQEVVRPERLVSTFVYEPQPHFQVLNTMTLDERGGQTLMTLHSRFSSKEHRDFMLQGGMEEGMTEGFERLEEWIALDAAAEPILRIERTFDAPRELLFACWTSPDHFKNWFMPEGFTIPYCTIDARPGGALHFAARWPEGFDLPDSWMKIVFREIAPDRIVATQFFSDEAGNFVKPQGMVDGFPDTTFLRVTFQDAGANRTKMIVEHGYPLVIARKQRAVEGWTSSFEKLARNLASPAFDAPGTTT